MEKNKTGKYFKYAIGEIILVVFGILIALQINNWNEKRIDATQELQLLKSCVKGLQKDLSDIEYNIKIHSDAIASAELILKEIKNNQPFKDSLSIHFGKIMSTTTFMHSTSAFETIKSKGIDIITNNTLRNQIIDVYDTYYTAFLKRENAQSFETKRGLSDIFSSRFVEYNYTIINKDEIEVNIVPLDFNALKSDQEFLYYLKSHKNTTRLFVDYTYKNLRNKVISLITALQNEINVIENIK